ncbi:50S ribosomal protein L35 [Patescibacteria group bacterium]|nr:50S ribosomal protein L35 [Patescibacteria group bacterium]MBU1970246.1 50S ribosomal protein L35 [Patescibacteria group bacterium]
MPKLKTKKTLAKRIKISKNGVVRRNKVGLKHLKVSKNARQKQRANADAYVKNKKIRKRLKRMLGKQGKNI